MKRKKAEITGPLLTLDGSVAVNDVMNFMVLGGLKMTDEIMVQGESVRTFISEDGNVLLDAEELDSSEIGSFRKSFKNGLTVKTFLETVQEGGLGTASRVYANGNEAAYAYIQGDSLILDEEPIV